MKLKTLSIIICNLLICNQQFSQSITNTLGASGLFSIKFNSTTYFSLSQSTGNVSLNKGLILPNTNSTSTDGIIFKEGDRFLHNYGPFNTFLGIISGNFTTSGAFNTAVGHSTLSANTTGTYNTAIGQGSLFANTTGNRNTAMGFQTLISNTSGYENTVVGSSSLLSNTTGRNNSAFGFHSLYFNTTGNENTAVGFQTLYSNTTGFNNSAFGSGALYSNVDGAVNCAFGLGSLKNNTTGSTNVGFGNATLLYNTTGSNNSAVGSGSLLNNTTGMLNTAIGIFSGQNISTGYNNTAIGCDAQVPNGAADNQVRIGNTSVTYAGIQVAWTITSDRKWKEDITTLPLGLKFISRLNPVSYSRINDESKKTEYGLIAQEVEEVLKEEGAENSAMITVTDAGNYELRYNDLLAPMIKAIQELKAENEILKEKVEKLEKSRINISPGN